ncbi:MAG: glutamate synthase-related protein [Legionella sp.]|uniref:glutamate synthase-related protein n=1 Tax=Legionella sp. TaxID=459 RepID=UPI00284EA5E7|nr:glutamate synthase-related protein [Legionella sp.]
MVKKKTEHFIAPPCQNDSSACGVSLIVHFLQDGSFINSHDLVKEGLDVLTSFSYRSGYNIATQESDGSGIRFYGLSSLFFNKLLKNGGFSVVDASDLSLNLKDKYYAIGQFFLAQEPLQFAQATRLIELCVKNQGLKIIGWRNLDKAMNLGVLSERARTKKPAIWQIILVTNTSIPSELNEFTLIELNQAIYYHAREQQIPLNIVSLSSEKIVYKGMIPSPLLAEVYHDLRDPDFTAYACDVHARFATNTSPQWSNAQPCPNFASHNGELNSAFSNAKQMTYELNAQQFKGIYPNEALSDSMQLDADLANQIVMKQIPLDEAVIRLLAPDQGEFPDEINAMLKYWSLERTSYNGPAFIVAGFAGNFIAKLDSMGLRPSRWALVEDRQGRHRLYAASDDFINVEEGVLLKKGHLEPGGMLLLTVEGKLLQTQEILEYVAARYHQNHPDYFQQQVQKIVFPLAQRSLTTAIEHYLKTPTGSDLERILYASGWDYETEDQVVRVMAENGCERTAAMGDDTNILYTHTLPPHISYFFHQLFAQVSAPPLDSIKERSRFSLNTFIGGRGDATVPPQFIELSSPILTVEELTNIEHHLQINSHIIDTSFAVYFGQTTFTIEQANELLSTAIKTLLQHVEEAVYERKITNLILSDRHAGPERAVIPDLIAVAVVRRFLEKKHLDFKVSITIDSYQITGPHQASTLLAFGAKAIYPRGAYAKIHALFPDNPYVYCANYREALQKCLLKTMGKMGITDVNNYINGSLVAALGLDLSPTTEELNDPLSLSAIFAKIYSPLKGVRLGQIAHGVLIRHQQANNPGHDFILLPRSGYYMPEKNGVKHGFGPQIVNAFTAWMNEENLSASLYQMHLSLHQKGYPDFIADVSAFSVTAGFLDPRLKDKEGFYPAEYLEQFKPSAAFKKFTQAVECYQHENPTSLRDYFKINADKNAKAQANEQPIQSQQEIRSLLYAGSMSQGALTVADPQKPHKLGAHETLTRGMNAVGAKSASGEGGEASHDLRHALTSTRSKQFASGRFGVSAAQILSAEEIEIKIAQGAKPGEGGELPGTKVSIRFAAQRGGLPHLSFISPPPHHDIYSIEDLEQLIYDLKSVKHDLKVAVKLVASQGIGAIAIGVAKAGADIINIAGNSGGTGAAQQSSIKHAGFPSELGLAEVNKALCQTYQRELVQLRVSGGFKTADDVLIAAILGADLFELGTMAMLTLGCKMQRTCNLSCQPGVATDGHLFKGDQINTERYFVNLAASIQQRLLDLGFHTLAELRDRTDLLQLISPESVGPYDFAALLSRAELPPVLAKYESINTLTQQKLLRPQEDELINRMTYQLSHSNDGFVSEPIALTTQNRSFGARIMGVLTPYLQENPQQKIVINTTGNAGQSYGFLNAIHLKHIGSVQDGCGKSMTGGELILCSPAQINAHETSQNSIAGNAMLYGASGGKIYVNGQAGHRFAILLKGAEVVVEGVGDFAFEYMTSGTGMILGNAGKGLGTGASGGIIFAHDPDNNLQPSTSVRIMSSKERSAYKKVILALLEEHREKTDSVIAKQIIKQFKLAHFKVLIPIEMDKIQSWRQVLDVIQTYYLRDTTLTQGMQVWLIEKIRSLPQATTIEFNELQSLLQQDIHTVFTSEAKEFLHRLRPLKSDVEYVVSISALQKTAMKQLNPVEVRLSDIHGTVDYLLLKPLKDILTYVGDLTQNAQGCSGCRAQSCSGNEQIESGCPSGKGINTINALLKRIAPVNERGTLSTAQWNCLRQAFAVQIQESPFISYTGAACPAPCQDACTETIPNPGPANNKRGGKLTGEAVHIKDIEYALYQLGRALGWFDGKKIWTKEEIALIFGGGISDGCDEKYEYDKLMQTFTPPFCIPKQVRKKNRELIIIGSGPAAMQMAYKALLDGVHVRMYEKSDKAGGLLVDGIPAHKFDKVYLAEDFQYLHNMGLELHLNSDVFYDHTTGDFRIKGTEQIIASSHNEHQFIAACIGAGRPKQLTSAVISELPQAQHIKLVQAIDFLKEANHIASILIETPTINLDEKEALIKKHLAHMDPRNKKIVVIGGGDTAQDVIRWLARYFNQAQNTLGELNILVRGPLPPQHPIPNSYPMPSAALSDENLLKKTEVEFVFGTELFLVEPVKINMNPHNGKLELQIKESKFKYAEQIQNDCHLVSLFDAVPRELKPIDPESSQLKMLHDIDLIICALGFEGGDKSPLIAAIEQHNLKNVYKAGDAAGTNIIVAAQNNANKIYSLIRAAMDLEHARTQRAGGSFLRID